MESEPPQKKPSLSDPQRYPRTAQAGLEPEIQFIKDRYNWERILGQLSQEGSVTSWQREILWEIVDKYQDLEETYPDLARQYPNHHFRIPEGLVIQDPEQPGQFR